MEQINFIDNYFTSGFGEKMLLHFVYYENFGYSLCCTLDFGVIFIYLVLFMFIET